MPYIFQDEVIGSTQGKWVRYGSDGRMIKGWYITNNGKYYYEYDTGAMHKGSLFDEGKFYWFDEITGKVDANGWRTTDGIDYWYERGIRQGVYGDPLNIRDTDFNHEERGREIYDPGTDAWYWLDANANGAKAIDKDVFIPYTFQGQDTIGKWVRYNHMGHMAKGWNLFNWFDYETGAMAKGNNIIDNIPYYFDETTGKLRMAAHIDNPHVNDVARKALDEMSNTDEVFTFNGAFVSEETKRLLREERDSFRRKGYDVSFVIADTRTGKGVGANVDRLYYSASTLKAPNIAGLVMMTPFPLNTHEDQMRRSLVYSDNEAYKVIRHTFGTEHTSHFERMAGNERLAITNYAYQDLSVREMARAWLYMHEFFTVCDNGRRIGQMLENPSHVSSINALPYRTQSKSGWINDREYRSMGDCGIVYRNEGDYVIAILSNGPGNVKMLQNLCFLLDRAYSDIITN